MLIIPSVALALPSIDEPLRTGAKATSDAAVVIGIEDYAFIPDVPFAKRDADAFYNFLVYSRGVPAERVELVRSPNKEGIERALKKAAESVSGDGVLWVYYAGHGAAHPEDGSRMLLGIDTMADPAGFADRAVKLDTIEQIAGGVQVVTILDTCYAGVGRSGAELAGGTRFAVPAYATTPKASTVAWTAASANQLSGPLDGAQHGIFTYFAIGALRGWADGELDGTPDGSVSLSEAHAYVGRMLRSANRDQAPELVGSSSVATSGKLEKAPTIDPLQLQAGSGASTPAAPPPPPTPVAAGPSASCPWQTLPISVAASGHQAVVGGRTYDLRKKEQMLSLEAEIAGCGFQEAAEAWSAWRGCYQYGTVLGALPKVDINPLKPQCRFTMKKRERAFAAAMSKGK